MASIHVHDILPHGVGGGIISLFYSCYSFLKNSIIYAFTLIEKIK